MVVDEIHFRVLYLVGAVGVLFLLRKPLRYPDRLGSKWFALTVVAMAAWLAGVGLYYFVHSLSGSLVLYNVVLFSVTLCFVGWTMIAVEFSTGKRPSRLIPVVLGTFALVHLVLLWTNFAWLHELVYQSTTFVDDGGGLNVHRGPLFWVHMASIYVLVFLSTVLFVGEWANASGLRRRQAGILSITPLLGVGASLIWFAEVLPFPFDPTPVGVAVGAAVLGWALYRYEFLEIVPVARQTVVEKMTDAVVILDDENGVVDWNGAASDLFGIEEPVVGMAASEFFEPVPDETLPEFASSSPTHAQISCELDGGDRHFSMSISPIESDGVVLGRVVVVRDITPIKRREAELLTQNESLDEFTSIVSHDLHDPLAEIRSSAETAVTTGDVSSVGHVLDATDRMEQLVSELLGLARMGRQIDELVPVELADVAESAWARVWSRDAELVVEDDLTVAADPEKLHQLLEKLFENSVGHGSSDEWSAGSNGVEQATMGRMASVKSGADRGGNGSLSHEAHTAATLSSSARPGGDASRGVETGPNPTETPETGVTRESDSVGDVTVTVGSLDGGFYVEDDGAGIPLEERERIFERGYTTEANRIGLGLTIVRQIAGAHGWSVCATEGTAGGARFEVTGVDDGGLSEQESPGPELSAVTISHSDPP